MVEKNGISITSLLQRSNPMRERNCRREDCFVCTSRGKGDFSRNNIVYEIKCNNCNSKYCGETAPNAYTRGKEHIKLLHEKEQNSPLWSHCLKEHNGHIQQFTMNVVRTFHRDSMMRQITEAIAAVTLAILPLGKWLFPTGKQFFMCNRSAQRKIAPGNFPWIRQK